MSTTESLIIGAGPCGLTVAAALIGAGRPFDPINWRRMQIEIGREFRATGHAIARPS